MSQRPISRSPDLARLRKDGYNIQCRGAYLLVRDVPYLNSKKEILRGILVSKLTLAGEIAARPDDHVAYFVGEYPCHADGTPIEGLRNASAPPPIADGVTANYTFSAKPTSPFEDYHAKVSNYCRIITGPAKTIDPSVSERTFAPPVPDEDEKCVFNYTDTATSRAEIDSLSQKLEVERVAIIGLGGTGSYVLDLVAKTPVREIHLVDGDVFLTHNAFRAPGAPSLEELEEKPLKVNYLRSIYSKMHRGIVAHPAHLSPENVELMRPMQFVFVCMDDGPAKRFLVDKLHEFNIPFVDVGMGVYVGENGLGGTLRVTTSTPAYRGHVDSRISFAGGADGNEYSKNIQVADLNALNAALAVMRWKRFCGFYMDFGHEHHSTFGIEVQLLSNSEKSAA